MKLNNFYFILRHGEARSNKERFVSSWPEKVHNPLTDKGRKKIERISEKLKKQKIDIIFSSDLLRTKQSAEIIAKKIGLKINFDKNLREIDMGIYNAKKEQSWNDFFKTNFKRFVRRPKNGENYRDVKKRVTKFIKQINQRYKNKKILIISHGCVLFSLQAIVKNLTEKQEIRFKKELILKTGELKELTPYI